MNKDSFVRTVRSAAAGENLSSFRMDALSNIGREVERGLGVHEAVEKLKTSVFSGEFDLLGDRDFWKNLERKLK